MKRVLTSCVTCFCSLLLLAACQSNTKQYRGKILELDFNNVEKVQPGSWMKIDEWKFTHVRSMQEGSETEFALPSDYIVIDSLEGRERPYGTFVNPKSIGLHIVRNLHEINNYKLGEDAPHYTVPTPGLLSVANILKIAKTDSSLVTITVPGDYPVSISVVEE